MRKPAALVVVALTFALLFSLASCSAPSSDKQAGDAILSQDELTSSERTPIGTDITIATPFYTIQLPSSYEGRIKWRYMPYETPYTGDFDNGPIVGHSTSLFIDGSSYAEFFVMISKPGQGSAEPLGPQGMFCREHVGKVECGGSEWDVLLCAAFSVDDEGNANTDEVLAKLEQYKEYVSVGFAPEQVDDESVFLGFLSTELGSRWAQSEEGADKAESKIHAILESGSWDSLSPDNGASYIRGRDDNSAFDYASMRFDEGEIVYEIAPSFFSLRASHGITSFDRVPSNTPLLSRSESALYEINSWEPFQKSEGEAAESAQKCGIRLSLIESRDGGSSWVKEQYLLYGMSLGTPSEDYSESGGSETATPSMTVACLGKPNCDSYYTKDDPTIRGAAEKQEEYLDEARALYRAAFNSGTVSTYDEFSQQESVFGSLPSEEDEVIWALPMKFEDYRFDTSIGYCIKIARTAENEEGQEIATNEVLFLYDDGNGKAMLRSFGGSTGATDLF